MHDMEGMEQKMHTITTEERHVLLMSSMSPAEVYNRLCAMEKWALSLNLLEIEEIRKGRELEAFATLPSANTLQHHMEWRQQLLQLQHPQHHHQLQYGSFLPQSDSASVAQHSQHAS